MFAYAINYERTNLMKMKYKKATLALFALLIQGSIVHASQTDEPHEYQLQDATIEAARGTGPDAFGNEKTSQSYYRTGGDITVIRREEIERKHYTSLSDAIRSVPGVRLSDTGFHGGMYGGGTYTNEVQINGDGHVVILLDGRRLDNGASNFASHRSYGGSKNTMALYLLNNMDLVEAIEVIKGPGASIYGSDATGGAINIITRRGTIEPKTTLDLATGSWNHHRFSASHAGSADGGTLRYYVAANRESGSDTHYKDGLTGVNRTFQGTNFKDANVSVKIDKDFDAKHTLSVLFNYSYDHSGMPLTAPDWRHMDNLLDDTLFHAAGGSFGWHNSDFWSKGYRNWFYYEGLLGSYTETIAKNIDVTYTFDRDHGMESFLRIFDSRNTYYNNRRGRLWGLSQAEIQDLLKNWSTQTKIPQYSTRDREFSKGLQLQFAHRYGKNDIIGGLIYKQNKWDRINPTPASNYFGNINSLNRNTFSAYVQDKIHLSDVWELTPAVRYDRMGDYTVGMYNGSTSKKSAAYNSMSLMLSTQYLIQPSVSVYGSWAQVKRPLWSADFDSTYEKLEDEKGNAYNIGVRKFHGKTTFDINYSYIDMNNAVGQYSVVASGGRVSTRAINAKQTKKALNFGVQYQFDRNWSAEASYSYVYDKFSGKNVKVDPDTGTSVDTLINSIRPTNQYAFDISYQNKGLNIDFDTAIYSGMNETYFTNQRFVVSRLTANYKLNEQLSVYGVLDNVFNTAWENKYYALCNLGAFPQKGRSFMLGMKYEF